MRILMRHEPTMGDTSGLSARPRGAESAVKERPILFRGEMVRAILDGRKTQTRRLVNAEKVVTGHSFDAEAGDRVIYNGWPHRLIESRGRNKRDAGELTPVRLDTYGKPGDRLWVRETWGIGRTRSAFSDPRVVYRADGDPFVASDFWKPSIHMKREHCRLVLEITDVRVERLQAISEEEAKAEGVTPFPNDPEGDFWTDGKHRTAFEYLWMQIHGAKSWMENPWLWVISFKRPGPADGTA